ncbi:MAG: PEP-CTERM sorting domain-containing protein [Planctomycetota bacterium]
MIGDPGHWRPLVAAAFVCLVLAFVPNPAFGAITVSLSHSDFQVGGTGSLFIEVSGSGEGVQQMSVDVRVRPIGTVGSSVELLKTPASDVFDDSLYLFKNNSFTEGFDPSVLVNVSTNMRPNDSVNINDSAVVGEVQVTSTRRLGRVDFEHLFPANTDQASLVGDQFEFEIVSASFTDMSFNPIVPTIAPSVTLTATAVPEPSSMLVCLGLGVATTLRWRRRRVRGLLRASPNMASAGER